MSTLRSEPVSRAKVVAGLLLALAVLAGIVLLADWLRPARGTPANPITAENDADPRVPVECAAAPAREGRRERAPRPSTPQVVSSGELYDCPTVWDGRPVRITGEVVGGVLQRDGVAWLQLNDDPYALPPGPLPYHRDFRGGNGGVGVLVPLDLTARITRVGGPRWHGDIVEVTGIFHRVDPQTREIAIVEASALRVVREGMALRQPVDTARVLVASGLALVAVALLVVQWRVRRSR